MHTFSAQISAPKKSNLVLILCKFDKHATCRAEWPSYKVQYTHDYYLDTGKHAKKKEKSKSVTLSFSLIDAPLLNNTVTKSSLPSAHAACKTDRPVICANNSIDSKV